MDGKRYRRGYDVSHLDAHIQRKLKRYEETSLAAALTEAVLTIASIPLVGMICVWTIWLLGTGPVSSWASVLIGIGLYAFCCTLIARQQRGLELMVHDASHRCWCNRSITLNNISANLLVAFPMACRVEEYWLSHRVHHGIYGSREDPCRRRLRSIGVRTIDLSTTSRIVLAVLRWLPRYNMAYYREISSLSLKQCLQFLAWHVVVLVAPVAICIAISTQASLAFSLMVAVGGWLLFWAVPATVFLPVLRSIAEMEEHDYERGNTEFETTFTNGGWLHRLLIHPKNDAYHLLHHMFPNIPERVHHRVHRMLMQHDEKYRSALHRRKLLETM